MKQENDLRVPHKSLIFGVLFILIGIAMLLYTSGLLPKIYDLWPIIILLFGLVLLYFVFAKGAYDVYMFPGFLFVLVGLSFMIINLLPPSVELRKIWPLFMINTGIALWLYAYSLQKEKRISLIVPAITIIILAIIFFLFSFNIIKTSFLTFIRIWWPLIFLMFGIFLVLESVIKKK